MDTSNLFDTDANEFDNPRTVYPPCSSSQSNALRSRKRRPKVACFSSSHAYVREGTDYICIWQLKSKDNQDKRHTNSEMPCNGDASRAVMHRRLSKVGTSMLTRTRRSPTH